MKLIGILIAFCFCFTTSVFSKDKTVVVEWKFTGIAEGYDHLNRNKVFVDGAGQAVSKEVHQSEWGKYTLSLAKGIHHVKLVNEAYYDGKWQEHTFENEFSVNAIYECELDAAEVGKIQLVFDLDGKPILVTQFDRSGSEIKPQQIAFKGKHYPLSLEWEFINIEKDYDHLSRISVYVDDVKVIVSPESLESAGGVFETMLPKGEHRIRIVSECKVDSDWKEHTILNNYSVDAVIERKVSVSNPQKVKWVIDLNNEATIIEW
jgi:hypothetical protein